MNYSKREHYLSKLKYYRLSNFHTLDMKYYTKVWKLHRTLDSKKRMENSKFIRYLLYIIML